MTPERAGNLLAYVGAIIHGHFVGTNGNHLSVYVAKDRATRFPSITSELCLGLAEMFAEENIEVVASPAVGAIALAQWTAYHLTRLHQDFGGQVRIYPARIEVLALYCEREEDILYTYKDPVTSIIRPGLSNHDTIRRNDELVLRHSGFELKRGFASDAKSKKVLVIEDTLTTGDSAAKTVDAVISAGGIVIGLGVLVNGGNVTAEVCGVKRLESLITIKREIFTEDECKDRGLCRRNVPINTEFGHGKEFLARKNK